MYVIMLLYLILTTVVELSSGGCPVSRCNWFPWESWSNCSSTCGGGTRYRYRRICCKASLASNIKACLSNCKYDLNYYYNGRSEYGLCNKHCYNGGTFIQSSTSSGYCNCDGFYHGTCCEQEKKKQPSGQGKCSKTCNWTPWASWNTCSVSCGGGGQQERTRELCCLESYGGFQTCAWFCGKDVGERTEIRSCGDNCLFGGTIKQSGFGCDCLDRTFGHCCDQFLPGCTAFPTDVIFVLDSSASQTREQFHRQLDFVNQFVERVNISLEEFQIAVVTYSTEAIVEINFNQSTDAANLSRLIKEITFRPGATFTDKGLKAAMEVARKSERRTGMVTLTYAFVLTDGMSNKRAETRLAATRLKNANVNVIAIGIGTEVSHQELRDIASPGDSFSPSYVFSVGDFNAIDTLLKQLVHDICDDCSSISHLSDVVFLLDESDILTETEFQLSIDIMESIIERTDHIGESNGPLFGLVQLGKELDSKIKLLSGQTQQTLLTELQTLYKSQIDMCDKDAPCGVMNITSAIEFIFESVFEKSGRSNSRKFLIVVSSGRFRDITIIQNEMVAIQNESDVKIFVIGPGEDVMMDGLLSLAKDANHVYVVIDNEDLTKLDTMQSEFAYTVCKKT